MSMRSPYKTQKTMCVCVCWTDDRVVALREVSIPPEASKADIIQVGDTFTVRFKHRPQTPETSGFLN